MTASYTPTLAELREAWVYVNITEGPQGTDAEAEAAAQFDRTLDEFGMEQYDDGFSAGVLYASQDPAFNEEDWTSS